MEQNKAARDPDKRICYFCQKPGAERWDGGIIQQMTTKDGKLIPLPSPLYCCIECDSRHKWFDLDEEDFE